MPIRAAVGKTKIRFAYLPGAVFFRDKYTQERCTVKKTVQKVSKNYTYMQRVLNIIVKRVL